MQLLLFSLSGLYHALPLASVEKVFPIAELRPLPGAPEIVEGFINIAGCIVPIFNIRSRFNLERKPA
ncbi:MAG TPA: chemotaxis protein CheW, partial [Burkholderiales bacterium]|nr:chemotaxis protein CheW [Burkholderiales bacterium]